MLERELIRKTLAAIVQSKLPEGAKVYPSRSVDLTDGPVVAVKIYLPFGEPDSSDSLLPPEVHELRLAYMRKGLVSDGKLDVNADPLRDLVLANPTLNGLLSGIEYAGYSYPVDREQDYSVIEYQFLAYEPHEDQ
jgi:hypothetical protein